MDFNLLIERKRERFEQLEREIADPKLFENRKRASDLMREHANTKQLLARWEEVEAARKQLDDNRELATSRDVEIAAMADDDSLRGSRRRSGGGFRSTTRLRAGLPAGLAVRGPRRPHPPTVRRRLRAAPPVPRR